MQNPQTETPHQEFPIRNAGAGKKTKKRHGCLTAWLILMMIGAVVKYNHICGRNELNGSLGSLPGWAIRY